MLKFGMFGMLGMLGMFGMFGMFGWGVAWISCAYLWLSLVFRKSRDSKPFQSSEALHGAEPRKMLDIRTKKTVG